MINSFQLERKENKSEIMMKATETMALALGGEAALNKSRPVCHGRYNISDAVEGNKLYNKLLSCKSDIQSNCSSALVQEDLDQLKSCKRVMDDYRC